LTQSRQATHINKHIPYPQKWTNSINAINVHLTYFILQNEMLAILLYRIKMDKALTLIGLAEAK